MDTQFSHEVSLVTFNGFPGNHQHISDFLGAKTFRQELQYFPFTFGQLIIRIQPPFFTGELLVIILVALLIFGSKRMPEIVAPLIFS